MVNELYIEIQLLCSVIFAILLYRIYINSDRRTNMLIFSYLLISCIFTFIFDAMQQSLNTQSNNTNVFGCYVFNILYYIALGANSYFWFLFSESEQGSILARNKRLRHLCALPFAMLVVMALTSPLNHYLFYVDEVNGYTRGSLHFVQLIISYAYLFPTSLKALYLSVKAQDLGTKHHMRETCLLIVPVMIAGCLQIVFQGLPIICAGSCVSLLIAYINIQEESISIDPLTKVNNRRRLTHHLQVLLERAQENQEPYAILMIDINEFKSINDVYGHVEGDRALISVGRALKAAEEPNMRVYRYGGDEFIVTIEHPNSDELERLSANIHAAIARECERADTSYTLGVSIGFAEYEPDDLKPQDIVRRADGKLYEAKKLSKAAL